MKFDSPVGISVVHSSGADEFAPFAVSHSPVHDRVIF
jgi:hypothetical protein